MFMQDDTEDFKKALANFNSQFVAENTLTKTPPSTLDVDLGGNRSVRLGKLIGGSRVLRVCVEMGAFEVMVGDIGEKSEKYTEFRRVCVYWNSRLEGREYDFVLVFGGVPYFSEKAPWFLAEHIGHGIEKHRKGYLAGPYSNGYSKRFSGDVWRIEIGRMVAVHLENDIDNETTSRRHFSKQARRSGRLKTGKGKQVLGEEYDGICDLNLDHFTDKVVRAMNSNLQEGVRSLQTKIDGLPGRTASVCMFWYVYVCVCIYIISHLIT